MKRQALSGIRWTALSSAVKACVHLAQLTILARLLSPHEFGLMGVMVAVVALMQLFADLGVSNAIIHIETISERQLSTLYWLNVCAGGAVAVLVAISSECLAGVYGEPALEPLVALSGLYIFITATSQQLRVVAEKNLQFSKLAKTEMMGALAALPVATALALLGAGVYSFLAGMLANAAVTSILLWSFVARGWRPIWCFRIREIRHFLVFGAYAIGNNISNTINSQVDVLLGGRLIGASALGAYVLPRDLCLRIAGMINPIATRVGLPLMAKSQHADNFLRLVYLRTIRLTASLNFPLYVTLAVFASEVTDIVFGPQWADAAPLLQVLACWGIVRSTSNPVGSLLFAKGRADLSFKWNMMLTAIFPIAVWSGGQYGSMGLALSLLLANIALIVPHWFFLVRPLCGAGFLQYHQQIAVPLALAILSGAAGYLVAAPLPDSASRLTFGVLMEVFAYVGLSAVLNKPLVDAVKATVLRRKLIGWQ